jgi:hypothetical protein
MQLLLEFLLNIELLMPANVRLLELLELYLSFPDISRPTEIQKCAFLIYEPYLLHIINGAFLLKEPDEVHID